LLGQRISRSPKGFKAWPQNLGRSDVLTTLTSYRAVPDHRQAELIRGISAAPSDEDPLADVEVAQLVAALARKVG
jgi:hypothetical protein